MERIVPEAALPDQVIVKLTNAYSSVLPDEGEGPSTSASI